MIIRNLIATSILLTSISVIADSSADEKYDLGEEAHKNHCYKCHTDEIYTRENSFVKSIDALSKQVVRCKDSNDIPWFDEDTETVIHFVNKKFYNF
jgi:hypothetical protein